MQTTAEHLNLAPPQHGHWLGPLGLALVVHGLLVAALTWGVGWQRDAPAVVFEAEIWSRAPQAAAPRAVEPPPPPPPSPPPEPVPKPQPVAQPAPPPPGPSEADLATARAKQKAEADQEKAKLEAAKKAAADKLAQDKAAAVKKAAAEKAEKAAKAAADKAAADKKAASDKERQQLAQQKREKERQLAEEKRLDELAAKEREAQMRRIMGQAGASGGSTATGTAHQSSGPSAAYGGRVAARIKPNVVFTETVSGNPRAEVEVRTLPDGTITTRRIVKSSGSPAWDEAVLRAIDRTGTLPRDTDGRVPSSLIIGLRPQD